MSYVVLARKWRPLSFDDVIGQEHVTATLKKAIEKKRVAHAFIFSGTRGVGKTTTARILARALNCEKGPTPSPCGECASCKGIVNGSSLDVLEIDGASNNSVDDIRELRENVGYASMGGKYRIFVIDEVHMLSKSAFNALLKTLEEPPPNVIFIFATTEPQKIPATIHSRCQRYDFRRIVPEQILHRLTYICDREEIAFEKTALSLIASKADGSMRDALSLLDKVLSCCPEKIIEHEARVILGLVSREVYERVMDAIAGKAPAAVFSIVREMLLQGFDLYEFILGLEEHLRDLLFSRINGSLEGLAAELETVAALQKSAERFSEGDLLRMMELVQRSENDFKKSAFPRFAVEMLLLKLVYLDSTVSLEQILTLVGDEKEVRTKESALTGESVGGGRQPEQKKKPDLTAAPLISMKPPEPPYREISDSLFADRFPEEIGSDTESRWKSFIDSLMSNRPNLGMFLSPASVAASTATSIDLVFSRNHSFQFDEVTNKATREEIETLLNGFMGKPTELHITLEAVSPGTADAGSLSRKVNSLSIENEISREPIIQSVIDMFDVEFLR
jgi:DNA polymerase-3 subunit gamma/tau